MYKFAALIVAVMTITVLVIAYMASPSFHTLEGLGDVAKFWLFTATASDNFVVKNPTLILEDSLHMVVAVVFFFVGILLIGSNLKKSA